MKAAKINRCAFIRPYPGLEAGWRADSAAARIGPRSQRQEMAKIASHSGLRLRAPAKVCRRTDRGEGDEGRRSSSRSKIEHRTAAAHLSRHGKLLQPALRHRSFSINTPSASENGAG